MGVSVVEKSLPANAGRSEERSDSMPKCDVCGNEYDKAFQITQGGKTLTFDSFECAIHEMAPTCAHCDCKIIGHGIEVGGALYCCAHCAHHEGGTKDRA